MEFVKLPKDYLLYASKKYNGQDILDYNKKIEKESGDKCHIENSSWFGTFNVAKSYKTKTTQIYKWSIIKDIDLIYINIYNEIYFDKIFLKTKKKLNLTIDIDLSSINYDHPYIKMSRNEKALYEFKFIFGYITLKEQYEFLKFIIFLIENKYFDINNRSYKSILSTLKLKKLYYNIHIFSKQQKYNRISIYLFDKNVIRNICLLFPKIKGVYHPNSSSFWFPDFIIYKMDIEEFILFNPHQVLKFVE